MCFPVSLRFSEGFQPLLPSEFSSYTNSADISLLMKTRASPAKLGGSPGPRRGLVRASPSEQRAAESKAAVNVQTVLN